MPLTQETYRRFGESERHISNEAFRNHLLNDEESLFDGDRNFCQLGMVMGMLAMMYEEDRGPEKVQMLLEECEQSRNKQ